MAAAKLYLQSRIVILISCRRQEIHLIIDVSTPEYPVKLTSGQTLSSALELAE